jgi:hypothetical protein
MRHDLSQISKTPAWILIALLGLTLFSVALLVGLVDVSGTVPGWVGLLALAAYASLLFIL